MDYSSSDCNSPSKNFGSKISPVVFSPTVRGAENLTQFENTLSFLDFGSSESSGESFKGVDFFNLNPSPIRPPSYKFSEISVSSPPRVEPRQYFTVTMSEDIDIMSINITPPPVLTPNFPRNSEGGGEDDLGGEPNLEQTVSPPKLTPNFSRQVIDIKGKMSLLIDGNQIELDENEPPNDNSIELHGEEEPPNFDDSIEVEEPPNNISIFETQDEHPNDSIFVGQGLDDNDRDPIPENPQNTPDPKQTLKEKARDAKLQLKLQRDKAPLIPTQEHIKARARAEKQAEKAKKEAEKLAKQPKISKFFKPSQGQEQESDSVSRSSRSRSCKTKNTPVLVSSSDLSSSDNSSDGDPDSEVAMKKCKRSSKKINKKIKIKDKKNSSDGDSESKIK